MIFQVSLVVDGKEIVVPVYNVFAVDNRVKGIVYYNKQWKVIDFNVNDCVPVDYTFESTVSYPIVTNLASFGKHHDVYNVEWDGDVDDPRIRITGELFKNNDK